MMIEVFREVVIFFCEKIRVDSGKKNCLPYFLADLATDLI